MKGNRKPQVIAVDSEDEAMIIPTSTKPNSNQRLMGFPRRGRFLQYALLAGCIIIIVIIFSPQVNPKGGIIFSNKFLPTEINRLTDNGEATVKFLPPLNLPEKMPSYYQKLCYPLLPNNHSISHISLKLELMSKSQNEECQRIYEIFLQIYDIQKIKGELELPDEFISEVKGWLNNDEKLFSTITSQDIYKVVNKVTGEASVFNLLRSKRPVSKPSQDPQEYVEQVSNSTKSSCDFCSYKSHTAKDIFGRIENKYSASASNTFKLAKFHGLFFPLKHHPLNISFEELSDLFLNTAVQWFDAAWKADPQQIYPTLLWDTLPHAGASQVHPHVHGLLDSNQYAGIFGALHSNALNYFRKYSSLLWSDILLVHWALNMVVVEGKSIAMVPITARKDHEYMILSEKLNEDVIKLLWNILQTYRKDLNTYCFSSGGALPLLHKSDSGLPVIFRIGSRGDCTSVRSDVSSLELYTVNNINSDLAQTYESLKKRVEV